MANVENPDDLGVLINGVPDSVLSAPRTPVAFEGLTKWGSHPVRVLGQWPVEKFHAGCGDGFG